MSVQACKSMENRIWLSSPTMHGPEVEYMRLAYETNWMSTIGENINEVEHLCAEKLGCKYAVALSCGTAAVHLAVKLAGVQRGEKVFCSDMTFAATVNPVVYEGGVPVFIDTEADTWNMDPAALERAFTLYPEVRVVIMAHLYGTPGKMDELLDVCERHNAILIEDAAESLGASYKGKQTGSFGSLGVISFNGNKIITGSAGGVLVTNEKEVADKARKWATQSREDAPWYQHEEVGYNYRMSNVIAGVIRGQFPYLQEHMALKKAIYQRYQEGFRDAPVEMNPYDKENSAPNHWLSCIVIREEALCEQCYGNSHTQYTPVKGKSCPAELLKVLAEHNIEARPVWKPMHLQPVFADSAFVSCRAGEDIGSSVFRRGICLPSDIKMTKQQQDLVISLIRSCFE